jgi:hypothetical protein
VPYPVNAGSKATGILRSGTVGVRHAATNDEGSAARLLGHLIPSLTRARAEQGTYPWDRRATSRSSTACVGSC